MPVVSAGPVADRNGKDYRDDRRQFKSEECCTYCCEKRSRRADYRRRCAIREMKKTADRRQSEI